MIIAPKIAVSFIVFTAVLSAISCSPLSSSSSAGGGSSSVSPATRNVPSAIGVNIPNSMKMKMKNSVPPLLRVSGNKGMMRTVSLRNSLHRNVRMRDDMTSNTSFAYDECATTVAFLGSAMQYVSFYFIEIDSAIDGLTASSAVITDRTITWTQDMVNRYYQFMTADEAIDPEMSNALQSMVGSNITVDPFIYSASTNSGYDLHFEYVGFSDYGGLKIDWSTDKKKVMVGYEYADTNSGYSNSTYFYYDDAVKLSKMIYVETTPNISEEPQVTNFVQDVWTDVMTTVQPDDTTNIYTNSYNDYSSYIEVTNAGANEDLYVLSMKADPNSTKNGVFLNFKDSSSSGGYTYSFDENGYADDSGGYILAKYTWKEPGYPPYTWWYKDGFDQNGYATYSAYSDDGINWINMMTGQPTDNSYAGGSYSGDYSEYDSQSGQLEDNSTVTTVLQDSGLDYYDLPGAVKDDYYLVYLDPLSPSVIDVFNDCATNTNAVLPDYVQSIFDTELVGEATCDQNGKVSVNIWYFDMLMHQRPLYLYRQVNDYGNPTNGIILDITVTNSIYYTNNLMAS